MEHFAVAQKGVSPKLLADLLTSIVTFVVAWQGISLDPEVAAAVAKVIGFAAGALVAPGRVVVEARGPASDELLPASVRERINTPEGGAP